MNPLETLPSLDAHAQLAPDLASEVRDHRVALLALTLSLDEAALAVDRDESHIPWGVGCHPRRLKAQQAFDVEHFRELVQRAAIIGEIGLDRGARVPLDLQLRTSRQALDVAADLPRLAVSTAIGQRNS